MNAREIIAAHLQKANLLSDWDELSDGLIAHLKAEGLFIGPLVATQDMCGRADIHPNEAGEIWDDMVAGWLRTEGA